MAANLAERSGIERWLAAKDLRYARELGCEVGARLPQSERLLAVLQQAVDAGFAGHDESAVAHYLGDHGRQENSWVGDTRFVGRTCVVTGAVQGIGLETARRLAAEGAPCSHSTCKTPAQTSAA